MNLHKFTWWLLVIGGLNWGLEVLGLGVGEWLLPSNLADLVYAVIGLSALYQLFSKK